MDLFEKFKAKLKRQEKAKPAEDEDHAATSFSRIFATPQKTQSQSAQAQKPQTQTQRPQAKKPPLIVNEKPAFSSIAFLIVILFAIVTISAIVWYWQTKANPDMKFVAQDCNIDELLNGPKVAGTKTETAKELYIDAGGWQEYLNSTYDYKTLFPPTWSAQVYPDNTQIGFYPAGESRGLTYSGDIVIFVHSNPKKLNVKGYYDGKNGPDLFRKSTSYADIKIGSETGVIFRDIKEAVPSTVAAAAHGSYIYEIVDPGNLHQKDNVFKFMVENFKFLK